MEQIHTLSPDLITKSILEIESHKFSRCCSARGGGRVREKAAEVQNPWKGTLGFVSDHPSATKVHFKSAFLELEKESRNVT